MGVQNKKISRCCKMNGFHMKINVNHLRLPAVVDAGVAVKHTALRVMQCDASSDVHIWCMAHTERDMQMS